jgi:hypothetical protein
MTLIEFLQTLPAEWPVYVALLCAVAIVTSVSVFIIRVWVTHSPKLRELIREEQIEVLGDEGHRRK